MDKNGNLLNFENGTLELDTFTFREHRKEDLLTKIAGCRFDKTRTATCPNWEKHLLLIFGEDQKFVDEFQQLCGYSLLADNPEQIFFVLHGNGKNGKSVTIQVLRSIIGEYGGTISPDTISARKFSEGGSPRSDLMDLPGKRILITSETDETTVLSEGFIKAATGGDSLKHRGVYQQREKEFSITAKLWYATNHKPIIRGTDDAIWRRVWLIPFEVAIPEEKRVPKYESLLLQEAPGILNWMLAGLQKIYDNGGRLKQPAKIRIASLEYRNESDTIGRFISECLKFDPKASVSREALYERYESWCAEEQEAPVTTKKFYKALREKGARDGSKSKNIHYMNGIREKNPSEEGERTL
jgi:putative DNA primase/helicase